MSQEIIPRSPYTTPTIWYPDELWLFIDSKKVVDFNGFDGQMSDYD